MEKMVERMLARENERDGTQNERERDRDGRGGSCVRPPARWAGKERNTLVYVFLVNSTSSIADFKSIYRHNNNNINIIIVIIYDC